MTHSTFLPSSSAPVSGSIDKEHALNTMDKALSVLVNFTLVLSISLALFMLLAAPGQPLDFLMSGSCGAGV